MIVSVSRRTDIPAFYSEWFFNRLKEGFVYVINPFNKKTVSKVELTPKTVDLFVFWTKDAEPMLKRLDKLKKFKYYFQFTITAYRNEVELGTRKKNDIIDTFKRLSKKIGKEKIIWRYDPIFLNDLYTKEYHYIWFEKFCAKVEGYTDKCIISFLDLYKKTERNTKCLNIHKMDENSMREIAKQLQSIASRHSIIIETCSEGIDLSEYGIKKGSCIDEKLISKIIDFPIDVKKDDNQRELCGCVKSVDIGQYNTCKHHCLYCYANFNEKLVNYNILSHNPKTPVLAYNLKGDEKIIVREMKSIKDKKQLSLFEKNYNVR
ncbi:DUF1848 domain-containing protein [Clostridium felsineum]|uniref:Uncharacterized protein n=1 Tax=Clostridium felsineum TaxID=36839 RepID=A0A1S8L309_9CLOT|nr:DUF1848 domain-containing protein [Clostridium felsineum]URZ07478.1 hypothetical protein CLROS_028160 [Clostridium felsineum]URZ12509.1 hypothetical protein CROST_032310 [Clostridium felsineum]